MNDTIIEIILIILNCLCIVLFIIRAIWVDNKPKKYYKIKYIFDSKDESEAVIESKTPKQAIDKLIRKYQCNFPLNEITDIISCTEINYYKCLEEESKDE